MSYILRFLVSWFAASIIAKAAFFAYPQMEPMCHNQSWKTCISSLRIEGVIFDPITYFVTGLLAAVAVVLNAIWPRTTNAAFYVPMIITVAGVTLLFFPTGFLDFWEERLAPSSTNSALLVWITALAAPYCCGAAVFLAQQYKNAPPSSAQGH